MVGSLVLAATGASDIPSAWRSLVKPTDRVGIKVAATGGRYFSTHLSIVESIVDGLVSAGVSKKNIIVWDRADMAAAGYRSGDFQVRSVEPISGYNFRAVFQSPVMGKLIWGDVLFSQKASEARARLVRDPEQLSDESRWSRILCDEVTKIVNVPVMSDADCGVAGCLYNVTIPNVDNWRRFLQPPTFGDPFIAELYADARIAPKVVLNLMDGLVAQYAGGPEFQPGYAFHHRTIYASKDPVALDATALREIEKWRAQAQLTPIGRRAAYLESAETMKLGNFAPERIEMRRVE